MMKNPTAVTGYVCFTFLVFGFCLTPLNQLWGEEESDAVNASLPASLQDENDDQVIASVDEALENQPPDFNDKLLEMGLPLVSGSRSIMLRFVKDLSTEEVVKDLVNAYVAGIAGLSNTPGADEPHKLYGWSDIFYNHLGVIRLIEEGKENPEYIKSLVVHNLRVELDRFPTVNEEIAEFRELPAEEQWKGMQGARAEDYVDFRYVNLPYEEHIRISFAIPTGLYILANIDRGLEDPSLLYEWINIDAVKWTKCPELNDYLIQCYMTQYTTESDIPEIGKVEVSSWKEGWAINDFMLGMSGVDTSLIKNRVKLLAVPRGEPQFDRYSGPQVIHITEHRKRFLAYVKSHGLV